MDALIEGELARRAGIPALSPETVELIGFIKRAKSRGFSPQEIRELLSLRVFQGRPEIKRGPRPSSVRFKGRFGSWTPYGARWRD